MSQVLEKLKTIDLNNSESVKKVLVPFFQNLGKHVEIDKESNKWLQSLEKVISGYPKYCIPHRNTIEIYISQFLDSKNYFSVVPAAKCAHLLQQVRPSQEKTATPKLCWQQQMTLLCNAVHTLIDNIFSDSVDIYQTDRCFKNSDTRTTRLIYSSSLTKSLSEMHILSRNSKTDKTALLHNRLKNVFIFIQAMLVEKYPAAKPVTPQIILDVIVRTLSVTGGIVPINNKDETQALHDSIRNAKIQALNTLDALIICLGSNLLPYSPLVFRLCMQTLRWSSENVNEDFRQVRVKAYNSLANWLTTLRCHNPGFRGGDKEKSLEDELLMHILKDIITCSKNVFQLSVTGNLGKNLSKKAKRKLTNNMLQRSSLSSHMPGEMNKVSIVEESNEEIAIAALKCAEMFLMVCGIFLKPVTHKALQEQLVFECYNLNNYSKLKTIALCHALDATRKSIPPGVPPPTQYCLDLYSKLIHSPHKEISNMCIQALLDIKLNLHCSPPPLSYNINSVESQQKTTLEQTLSKRNRKALFGPKRVPGPDNSKETETITICDEPVNKKQKLDADIISDQITVSSDSSIEISDDDSEDSYTNNDVMDGTESLPNKTVQSKETMENENVEIHISATLEKDMAISDDELNNDTNNKECAVELHTTSINQISIIHELNTQLPQSSLDRLDVVDGTDSLHSVEVLYDYPNTGSLKVITLEKMDSDNLPNTNETDDVQITCGQTLQNSQDSEKPKSVVTTPTAELIQEHNDTTPGNTVDERCYPENIKTAECDTTCGDGMEANTKKTDNSIDLNEMLADFVDEVNESITAE